MTTETTGMSVRVEAIAHAVNAWNVADPYPCAEEIMAADPLTAVAEQMAKALKSALGKLPLDDQIYNSEEIDLCEKALVAYSQLTGATS